MNKEPRFLPLRRDDFQPSKAGIDLGLPEIALRWAIQAAGWRKWKARQTEILNHLDSLHFPSKRLQERHCVELAVPVLYERLLRGETLWQGDVGLIAYVIVFCNALMVLSRGLSESGQKRLEGSIRDALGRDFGFGVIQSEINALYQLLDAGLRVAATDLDGGGTFDFLAESEGEHIEVESKMLTQEKGTQIPPRDFERFLSHLRKSEIVAALRPGRACLITLTVSKRLPNDATSLRRIAKAVVGVLRGGEIQARHLGIDFQVEELQPATGSGAFAFNVYKEARRIHHLTGKPNMPYGNQDRAAIVAGLEPRQFTISSSQGHRATPQDGGVATHRHEAGNSLRQRGGLCRLFLRG